MSTEHDEVELQGQRLLTAVEHLVDDPDTLIADVEALADAVVPDGGARDAEFLDKMARRLIATYSNRSAVAGGLTALPATLPGVGTVVTLTGGAMVDMAFMLRHEVELAMCLTHLYGYDIRDDRQRWLAYILAGVSTYEAKSGRNYFVDLAEAQLEAMTLYTPRQLSKIMATILGKLAILSVSKGLVKGLPLVGVAVGVSANKVLTTNVGWRCVEALERRRGDGGVDDAVVEASIDGQPPPKAPAGDKGEGAGESKAKGKGAKGSKAKAEDTKAEAGAAEDAAAPEDKASETKEDEADS